MVDNAQLLPQVVAGTQTRTGFKHSTFRSEGEPAYQYTKIASSYNLSITKTSQPIYITLNS